MDFETDLNKCLENLALGRLVGIPTVVGWMLTADATNHQAVSALLEIKSEAVVMLADKLEVLRHVGNLDLNWSDWLEEQDPGTAAIFGRILGVVPALLTDEGNLALTLAKDKFSFHLIKRFRKPLAMVHTGYGELVGVANYVAQLHGKISEQGFQIKSIPI